MSALVGTTIGAGIFGIPFAFLKGGVSLGILYLITLTTVNLILNLAYGEIILRTKGDHQLAGYAQIYLGSGAKRFTSIAQILGLFGAMLAYIILSVDFLAILLNAPQFTFIFSVGFSILGSLILLFGLKSVSKVEDVLFSLLILLPIIIIASGYSKINPENFSTPPTNAFLPYGVFLFSLSGSSVIPEVEEILRKQPSKLFKAVFWGTIIPAIVYLIFGLGVLGISGKFTSEDALAGLSAYSGPAILKLGAILGLTAVITSFLTIGFVLRELFFRDLKLKKTYSWALASFTPLIFYLFGFKSFINVIGFTGAILLGSLGIIIMLIYQKALKASQKVPNFNLNLTTTGVALMILIFAIGIILEVISI